jgi:hypothetical protein
MEIVKKYAVLISWPRELDMFSAFIKNILGNVVIIVDDFIYTESERFENGKNIIETIDGKYEYVLLSEVIGKTKYEVLFSTGDRTYLKKITLSSYFKYIYAISIGSIFESIGLSKFFTLVLKRPLSAGGKNALRHEKLPVERMIGKKIIKYPKGLDINKLVFPENRWNKVFDLYLCHSDIDQNLISLKFPRATCLKIGYPRYDYAKSIKVSKKTIFNEIKNLNQTKKILLWMPTFINFNGDLIDNVEAWTPLVSKLLGEYNVLISIHPKMAVMNPSVKTSLEKVGFSVDASKGRNLKTLYQAADLVFGDYGGSVLSTIYMKKKLILLNSPNQNYINWRKSRQYIDDEVRSDVKAFDLRNNLNLLEVINQVIQKNDLSKRVEIKEKYFGRDCNYDELRMVFKNLST